jgi:hypothetical protein
LKIAYDPEDGDGPIVGNQASVPATPSPEGIAPNPFAGSAHEKRSADSLDTDIDALVAALREKHATRIARRPHAFKRRVLSLIKSKLPPLPKPSGRPRNLRVTHAAEMYAEQLRERQLGTRARVNWIPIAKACIPGFHGIRSEYVRRGKLGTLRDAVYARRRAKRAPQKR